MASPPPNRMVPNSCPRKRPRGLIPSKQLVYMYSKLTCFMGFSSHVHNNERTAIKSVQFGGFTVGWILQVTL